MLRARQTRLRIPTAQCVRVVDESFASKPEGVGNAGRPMHPQPRVRMVVVKCTRVFTARSPKSPGIPTQWFTAYTVLSPVIGFLATVVTRINPQT